jgi:hypothetical protein
MENIVTLCSRNYALICSKPLFYILAPTYFGSSLPSSGSFFDPSELLEMQIEWVVYHVVCVPECRCSVCCASQLIAFQHSTGKHNRRNHNTLVHRPCNHTLNDVPPIRFVFQVTQKYLRISLMMAGYCRNM